LKSKTQIAIWTVTLVLGYLFQCLGSDKLIFLDQVFQPTVFAEIKKDSFWILVAFGVLYAGLSFFQNTSVKRKEDSRLYKNLARFVFEKSMVHCASLVDHDLRVTVFKSSDRFNGDQHLVGVGRFQKTKPFKNPKIKFSVGEGCAGICFKTQMIVSKQIGEYDPSNPDQYWRDCEKELSMPKKRAMKTNRRSACFLCLPLKTQDSGETWGIIVLDTMKKSQELERLSRPLEELISSYSFIFTLGGQNE